MNFKIGIIWALIITTVASTGAVIYNNLKVKDAHDLIGELGANVISSFGSGSSSGVIGYDGYNEVCLKNSNRDFPYRSSEYFNEVDVYGVIEKIDNKIKDFIEQLKKLDPSPTSFLPSKETLLIRQLEEIRGLVPGAIMGTYNSMLCVCLHPGHFKQQANDLLSSLDQISINQYSEMNAAEAMAARTIIDTIVISKINDAAKNKDNTCERSNNQLVIPIEPMPGTPSLIYLPTKNISPVSNQSKLQIINTGQSNNSTNQSGSLKLSNPISAPKPLVPTNTFQQTAPLVGPVQSPTTPTAIAPIPVPQKLSSSQICSAVGWPTVNACGGYTAYASRQSNPAYTYKGVTYSMSYTLHKNTTGAVCRDLCVGTAKN